jgi:hypothetical protein
MDLHPISMKKGYSVDSALDWALEQLALIEAGKAVHQDIKPSLLEKISRLPVEPDDSKIKNFKLNGRADIIEFDQQFQINALQQARDRRDQLEGSPLFEGEVLGEVRGQLREVSSIGGDRAIITPAIGPDEIECVHSERVRDKIGRFYDKNVIARGTLIYTKESPFPIRVRLLDDGLSIDKAAEEPRPTLFELRGIFALAKAG